MVQVHWKNIGQGAVRRNRGGRCVRRLLPRQGSLVSLGRIVLRMLILLLLQWLGKQSFLNDPTSLDLDLYPGLIFLKHYPGNPEDPSLNFAVADEGEISYRIGDFGAQYMLKIWHRADG